VCPPVKQESFPHLREKKNSGRTPRGYSAPRSGNKYQKGFPERPTQKNWEKGFSKKEPWTKWRKFNPENRPHTFPEN